MPDNIQQYLTHGFMFRMEFRQSGRWAERYACSGASSQTTRFTHNAIIRASFEGVEQCPQS
jgi:hypothetical protein